jgi:hypothetical protein
MEFFLRWVEFLKITIEIFITFFHSYDTINAESNKNTTTTAKSFVITSTSTNVIGSFQL